MAIEREQIVAFRLSSHNLTRRLAHGSLVEATAACGVQETPLASAEVALLARIEGLTPQLLESASSVDRTLVTLWSMRGAPYVIAARDLDVFSVGALPVNRRSFNHFLGGWAGALREAGIDPITTLDRMTAAAEVLLDGRTLNVNDLRDGIHARVRSLSKIKRPESARSDMPEPLFRAVGTAGAVCIVAGRGTDATMARADQWLGAARSRADPDDARAELARRFLHCYGPATAQYFADWTQRDLADAKDAFSLIGEELDEVDADGKNALLLRSDREGLGSPPEPRGVRLLPVQDPYLQQRDRAALLPDVSMRRKLWQPVRGPGGVLADGEVVGTWRVRSQGRHLGVTIEPFKPLRPGTRVAIGAEAERIAAFRRVSAEVRFSA